MKWAGLECARALRRQHDDRTDGADFRRLDRSCRPGKRRDPECNFAYAEIQARANDDVFFVNAAAETTLPLLSNDTGVSADTTIRLIEGPACGTLDRTEEGFVYTAPAACAGQQTFRYCIADNEGCDPAHVSLTIRTVSPGKAGLVAMGRPETDGGLQAKLAVDPNDPLKTGLSAFVATPENQLKIVELGASDDDIAVALYWSNGAGDENLIPRAVQDMRQTIALDPARAAAFLQSYTGRSVSGDPAARLSPTVFDDASIARSAEPLDRIATAVFVPGPDDTAIARTPPPLPAKSLLSDLKPELAGPNSTTDLADDLANAVATSVVDADPATQKVRALEEIASLDPDAARESASTAPCAVTGGIRPNPGAHVRVGIFADCLAGQTVILRHGGVDFVAQASSKGAIVASLPAISDTAAFQLLSTDGDNFGTFTTQLADFDALQRVLVLVENPDAVEIVAREHDRSAGSWFDVSSLNVVAHHEAVSGNRGYVRVYGARGGRVFSYTLPAFESVHRSAEVLLKGKAGADTCGSAFKIGVVGGNQAPRDQKLVRLPGCGADQIALLQRLYN